MVLILSVACSSGEEASSSNPKQPLAPAKAAPSIDPDPAADPLPAKKAEDLKVEFSVIDALGNKV